MTMSGNTFHNLLVNIKYNNSVVSLNHSSAGNNGRSTFNDRQNPVSDRLKLPSTDQNDR